MNQMTIPQWDELSEDDWDELEKATAAFDLEWNNGTTPDIHSIQLPQKSGLRERTIIQLIKMDQEYRWRRSASRRWPNDQMTAIRQPRK